MHSRYYSYMKLLLSPAKEVAEGNAFCGMCLQSVFLPGGSHVTITHDATNQSQVRWRLPLAPAPLAPTTQGHPRRIQT